MLRRVTLSVMARLKTILLLLIVVLLVLNVVLPTRYTLKLVPVTPENDAFDTRLPSREMKQVEPSHESTVLVSANRTERATVATVRITVPPTTERRGTFLAHSHKERPFHEVRWAERERDEDMMDWEGEKANPMFRGDAGRRSRWPLEENDHKARLPNEEMQNLLQKWRNAGYRDSEFSDVFGGMLAKREQEQQMDSKPNPARINFHDPVQRMKYYKALRSKYGNPALRQRGVGKASMFRRVVDSMWDGWFEGDGEDQPFDLSRYVATDATPAALERELRTCSLALEVPETALEQQKQDLERASKKLSVFLSALRSIIPRSYSSDYSSPCWESRIALRPGLMGMITHTVGTEGELRLLPNQAKYLARQALSENSPRTSLFCLPHFFIAGFPKSATTTLAKALFRHPSVSSSAMKECHWWTRAPIISPNADLLQVNVVRYLIHFKEMAHFAEDRPYLLAMDGSQSTLWDSNFVVEGHDYCATPAAISHTLPRAKFIILMREPSSRLYSYYLWSCSYKYGNHTLMWPKEIREDPAGNFHKEVVEGVADFNRCLERRSLYECTNRYTFTNITTQKSVCGQVGFRLVVSIYYIHIQKFLQFFPREQFLFLKMEDMSQSPVEFMRSVTDFLGLDPLPSSTSVELLGKRLNNQRVVSDQMRDDTRRFLTNFFAPYNRKLADLIGDERFLWQ